MEIGRKATDQRTPCRKFLATPLMLHAVCGVRKSAAAGQPNWCCVLRQWTRIDRRQTWFWSVRPWYVRACNWVLYAVAAWRHRSTVGSRVTGNRCSMLVMGRYPRLLWCTVSPTAFNMWPWDAGCTVVAQPVTCSRRPNGTHTSVSCIPGRRPILRAAWYDAAIPRISFGNI